MNKRYFTLAEGKVSIYLWTFCRFQLVISYLNKGCPHASNATSVQLRNGGGGGLQLLQDTQLIETLAHFSRENPRKVSTTSS